MATPLGQADHPSTVKCMLVRPAASTDAEAIAAINAAAWKQGFTGVVHQDFLNVYDGAPEYRRRCIEQAVGDEVQLVATDAGRVLGWAAGAPCRDEDCDDSTYELQACYVDPAVWRTGAGRRLVEALVQGLPQPRWEAVVLWTPVGTPRSHRFYESLGFTADGAVAVLDRGGPLQVARFRRPLLPPGPPR